MVKMSAWARRGGCVRDGSGTKGKVKWSLSEPKRHSDLALALRLYSTMLLGPTGRERSSACGRGEIETRCNDATRFFAMSIAIDQCGCAVRWLAGGR